MSLVFRVLGVAVVDGKRISGDVCLRGPTGGSVSGYRRSGRRWTARNYGKGRTRFHGNDFPQKTLVVWRHGFVKDREVSRQTVGNVIGERDRRL